MNILKIVPFKFYIFDVPFDLKKKFWFVTSLIIITTTTMYANSNVSKREYLYCALQNIVYNS